jgi:hypothetical protein
MAEQTPLAKRDAEKIVDSLSSLILGAALIGRDALADTLQELEVQSPDPTAPSIGCSVIDAAAVGLLVEGQRIAIRTARQVARTGSAGMQMTRSIAEATVGTQVGARAWAALQPLAGPFERRFNQLVEVGRQQEAKARSQADSAFRGMTEGSIREVTVRAVEEVARSEGAREVIRVQTMGVAEATVDEVRGIAKDADSRLENLARSIFGRSPRPSVPATDSSL